jgi:hypothetical protein
MPELNTCSKCDEPSTNSIFVRNTDDKTPPSKDGKDMRGTKVVRFCKDHWAHLMDFLAS